MKENQKQTKGITLIALVITIIVLLILAGITIAALSGDNGILTQASRAKEKTEETQEKEGVELAVTTARIGENGYQDLKQINLQKEIDNQFGNGKAIVTDNNDGTFTVSFIDSKRDYNITSNGVEKGINWNETMANAVAPVSQDEPRNENVIGIGTDGKPVDMDLWEWDFDEVTNGYALNSAEVLQNTEYNPSGTNISPIYRAGYLGNIVDGKLETAIPVYISTDNGKTYKEVTSLYRTFNNIDNLIECPNIPYTVVSMKNAFENCTELTDAKIGGSVEDIAWAFATTKINEVPNLPKNINNMYGTFVRCNSLTNVDIKISRNVTTLEMTFSECQNLEKVNMSGGENVKNMIKTFALCSNLLEISNIPPNVQNMHQTFFRCINLTNLNNLIISESANNLIETFSECTNLSGTLIINANITEQSQYDGIFNLAAKGDKKLKVKGECSVIDDIIAYTNNNNIIKE